MIERTLVKFRMFEMPCCHHCLCWVNPRLPNYCPECGERVYIQLKSGDYTLTSDDKAWLGINGAGQAALATSLKRSD